LRKESLGREIISIAFPTMISGLTDSILNLLTIIFISKTASEYIGVVSLASYLMMIVASITTIFMIGLLVVLSQSYGADRKDLLNQYFNEAFTLSIAVSLMIFLISYQLIDQYIRSIFNSIVDHLRED
jgi:Na+-driven multidrug efflux pump